jgi:preprotein translocase subunit SecY
MFKTIANAFKIKDLRKKILLTLLLLLVYRVGCYLPIPGFDVASFKESLEASGSYSIFGIMNMISGGALSNFSILALGVSPYITASIVIQLLTVAIPSLERLSKQGESGKQKMTLYTRIAALVLSVAQAIGIVASYSSYLDVNNVLWAGAPTWLIGAGIVVIMVAGGMFTVWLGEKITDLGVGNGMSLLIFIGILSSASTALYQSILAIGTDLKNLWTIIIFAVAVVLIFGLIVMVDSAERRVPLQYAKQMKGRKMYGGQNTYIPIRVNSSGVMPVIFASALITFPQIIMNIFWPNSSAIEWYQTWLGTGSWVYICILPLLILGFAYFYSMISFNPEDVSKRIQQQGGFIPGIRPGKPTAEYLGKISKRITFFGALFLAVIVLIPSLAFKAIGDANVLTSSLINAFSATGLMIIVSVALEMDKQLEAQMIMRNYKGFLD